jgi:hypothetical protein
MTKNYLQIKKRTKKTSLMKKMMKTLVMMMMKKMTILHRKMEVIENIRIETTTTLNITERCYVVLVPIAKDIGLKTR